MKFKHFITTSLLLAGLSTSAYASTNFADIQDHWGKPYIEDAVERGFFKGQSETEFAPEANITRAEFTVVMLQITGISRVELTDPSQPWYAGYYEAASANYLIPDSFTLENLNEPITREEIAATMVFTVGAHYFPYSENEVEFSDSDEIAAEYTHLVTAVVDAGLMYGMDGGFNPKGNATRAQAATVVVALSDKFFAEEVPYDNDLSRAYADIINSNRSADEMTFSPTFASTTNQNWLFFQPVVGFEAEDMEGFSVAYGSAMTQAYCIAIVKPVEGAEDKIIEGFKAFQQGKMNDFEFYLYDQYEIARDAVIEVLEDGTCIMVMCADTETLSATIKETLADFDLDTFEFSENMDGVGGMLPDMDDAMVPGFGGLLTDDDMSLEFPETMTPDVATPDTATPDVATPDTATPDTATPDTATPDVATPDTATPDATTPEATTPDASTPETSTPDETETDTDSNPSDLPEDFDPTDSSDSATDPEFPEGLENSDDASLPPSTEEVEDEDEEDNKDNGLPESDLPEDLNTDATQYPDDFDISLLD